LEFMVMIHGYYPELGIMVRVQGWDTGLGLRVKIRVRLQGWDSGSKSG
jgi:hypothetical protein